MKSDYTIDELKALTKEQALDIADELSAEWEALTGIPPKEVELYAWRYEGDLSCRGIRMLIGGSPATKIYDGNSYTVHFCLWVKDNTYSENRCCYEEIEEWKSDKPFSIRVSDSCYDHHSADGKTLKEAYHKLVDVLEKQRAKLDKKLSLLGKK